MFLLFLLLLLDSPLKQIPGFQDLQRTKQTCAQQLKESHTSTCTNERISCLVTFSHASVVVQDEEVSKILLHRAGVQTSVPDLFASDFRLPQRAEHHVSVLHLFCTGPLAVQAAQGVFFGHTVSLRYP